MGILGTPVIDERTNHIYLVTYSQSGSNFYHRLHALFTGAASGTIPLTEDTTYNSPVLISSGSSFVPAFVSANHIQRPGLLLLPSTENPAPEIYVAFSMMDGATNFPPGFVFRYTGDNLSLTPIVYTTEPTTNKAGGGIWMDGAGLAAGIDSANGSTYLYVTTADGDFDSPNGSAEHCVDCGDSFVKLGTSLGVNSSFIPADQACRFVNNPLTNPDLDFGSGGVTLIPDTLLMSWPYLAVNADKNQNIWVMQRSSPGFYNGGTTCTNGTNANLETVPGTGLYHNTPAFWSAGASSGYLYYSSLGGPISQYPVAGTCTSGTAPLCNASGTGTDSSGATVTFHAGVTPSISSSGTSNGILWAQNGASVEGTNAGVLWAFNATTMKHLYNTTLCTQDAMYSATQFSVPTVADGHVYIGAQSNNNTGSPTKGQGTFYVFGQITNKTCTAPQ